VKNKRYVLDPAIRCRANLALVEVDDIVENDGLKEGGRLGRRPPRVERCFDTRNDVRSSQHHVEHVQNHRLHSNRSTV